MQEPIRILILEDDLSLLQALREVIGDLGHEVAMASESEGAVELAFEQDFDILVTDIRMAGMDGLEALARMREVLPDLRSLVITGFSSETDTVRALRLGVGEYLTKPFDMDVLSASVERLVAEVRALREQQQRERAIRKVLIWALEGRAPGAVSEAGKRAADFALRLQLESGGAESVQLATLCELLSEQLPDEWQAVLPPRILAILRAGEGLDRQIILAAQTGVIPAMWRDVLDDSPTPARAGRQQRTALALAIRSEESGDVNTAVQAYTRLAAAGPSREAVRAALNLARIALRWQRAAQVAEYTQTALTLSSRLGPLTQAQTALEAGLLANSEEILRGAAELNERLGESSRAALAHTVLHCVRGQPPEAQQAARISPDELAVAAWWLVPRLLEHDPNPASDALLQRCFRLRPTLRQADGLSERARERLRAWQAPAETPGLRLFSLGLQEIYVGDTRLPEDAFRKNQKARLLLLYLALQRGRSFGDDVLAEIFWPAEGGQGRKNLYSLRSIWRKAFSGHEFVARTPHGLGMSTTLEWTHDAEELQRLLGTWAGCPGEEQLRLLQRIAALYRGPFLENCYMDWAVFTREQLDSRVVEALLALAARLTQEAGPLAISQRLELCQRVVEIDPCCQEAYRNWMSALNQSGRPQEALKVFERCQRVLQRELGVEPAIALLEEQTRARLLL